MPSPIWSWNEAPFSTNLESRRFFSGTSQEEALSRLHFLVDNRRRLGLLVGPHGCGKSMTLEVCSRQFRQQGRIVVRTGVVGVDAEEFQWTIAAGLGANPKSNATSRELWREIEDRILANRYQRLDTVLLVDDAEEAETEVLTSLTRLAQFDLSEESRFTIVLAADIARSHLLGRRLQELCDLRVELEPWDREETAEFIRTSLTAAACNTSLFTDGAAERLFELTGGIPRRVQQLAQLSLLAATAQDLVDIDEDTLEAVQRELSVQPTAILS